MAVNIVPTVIYSSMLGMTLFALVATSSKPKQRQTVYLIGLLTLLLTHILGELFIYSGAYQYAPSLAGAQFPLRMLLGPALYLYAWATMSPDDSPPKRSYFIALLGPVSVIIVMLPFVMGSSAEEKLALAVPATRDPELWRIAVATCSSALTLFIVFTGAYLVATLKLHAKHRRQLMQRFSDIEQRSMDWFKTVLLLWGCAWLLYAVDYFLGFFGMRWFGTGIVLPIIEAVILMLFAHLAIKQPVLEATDKGNPLDNQPRTAGLQAERMQQIADKLKHAMNEEALFKEEDLSLKRLSDAIAVSENHISETLSQCLHTNFFELVNGYRVEEAKIMLRETEKLVSTIAFDAGFNTKSTFNTAFKKSVGLTPSAYRKQEKALMGAKSTA